MEFEDFGNHGYKHNSREDFQFPMVEGDELLDPEYDAEVFAPHSIGGKLKIR